MDAAHASNQKMAAATHSFRVLVIGGGPAGLLVAQALQKNGFQCTVFEQDASLDARPRDWNFGIYWAQVPLGDCLPDELSRLVIEKGQVNRQMPDPDNVMPLYNGQTGELMKSVPAPNSIRLHRRNFLHLLSDAVDIRYNKRLKSIDSNGKTATVYFEDGTLESGDLVVGAEGAHSKVREFLVGRDEAQLIMSPIFASTTLAKLPKESAIEFQKLHKRYLVTFHPNGQFTWIGVHDAFENTEPGDWHFMIIQSWLPKKPHDPTLLQGSAILPDMKERANLHAEPFKTFIQSIPEGTKCWHNQLSYWVTSPWDNRNSTVTLVGDAAHPMTFHRGQGLNNAIHDAASLAKHLMEQGTSVPAECDSAVTAYEREVWKRGKEAVENSNQNSLAIHDWNTLLQSPLFTLGLTRPSAKQAELGSTNLD